MSTDSSFLRIVHRLVAAVQAGEPHALDDLIAHLRPAVFNYSRSRLGRYPGGAQAADDVAQETCLAVCKILPNYRDDGLPFTALVFAIASNKVVDSMRAYSRSAVLVDEMPEQAEAEPGPEESAMSSFRTREAHHLVERLAPRTREVLLLRAAGVSAEDVGERLGMTAGAVRVAHHRGVAKLRQMVAESAEHQELFNRSELVPAC